MSDHDAAGQRSDGDRDVVPKWALDGITHKGGLRLDLNGRDLGGEIPAWVYQLTDLRGLDLARCRLAGAIPAELGKLGRLEWLDLSGNALSGAIPTELGKLGRLERLDLSGNALSGAIPAELGELGRLRHLDLSKNELAGAIPVGLGKLRLDSSPWGPRTVDLSENQLSGTIPVELGQLGGLTHLNLSENQLIGAIPAELGQLGGLERLDLSKNQLSDAIPTELGQLINLYGLNLSENQLSGAIPAELGRLGNLERLDLSMNKLIGPIPRSFRSLRYLRHLSLDASLGQRGLSPDQRKLVRKSRSHSSDELTSLIAAGETKAVEFKSTLRANLHNECKHDQRIEHEVLKNIAAFLNTKGGGTLIIGVDDDGNPLGLDHDGFPDEDEMGKHLRNIVNGQIGASVWGSVHPEFTSYRNERVLVIRCDKSSFPVYVGKNEEFYIRTGPGATALKTSEIPPYVSNHFSDPAPPAEDDATDGA